MLHPIYDYDCYREYLRYALDSEQIGRGGRGRLAQFLDCQPSFISQVLSGKNDLSLEHGYRINQFLSHGNDETNFFMALVHLGRSGSHDLKKYYEEHVASLRKSKLQISEVTNRRELPEEAIVTYTSNWLCMAIHMMVAIPALQTREALLEKLRAKPEDLDSAIEFLVKYDLVREEKGLLVTGEQHLHLKKSSPYAQSASVLTRLKVLDKLRIDDPNSLNYSLNLTLSEEGMQELKKMILKLVAELPPVLDIGKPSKFCTMIIDLIEH